MNAQSGKTALTGLLASEFFSLCDPRFPVISVQLWLLVMVPLTALGQRTIPMNLERLVQDAGVIVRGTVVGTESQRDPATKLLVTYVTIDVRENFYGAEGSRFTFKQYGGSEGRLVYRPAGAPRYDEGEELILMLYPKSEIGMQSPVGMEQGKFMVKAGRRSGGKTVSNSLENRNLFKGLQNPSALSKRSWANASNPGSLDVVEFAQTIRSLVRLLKK
ncbi:MAG: hypothetical protein WBD36_10710 [Bacteroidota bacterium]